MSQAFRGVSWGGYEQAAEAAATGEMMLIQRVVSSVARVQARTRRRKPQLMQAAQWELLHIDLGAEAAFPLRMRHALMAAQTLRMFGLAFGESCAMSAALVSQMGAGGVDGGAGAWATR